MSNPNNEIEQQLFTLLRRTFAIHVTTASGAHELDRSAYGILCLVADQGPQRLGQIAQAFNLDPSTITRQVQAVVNIGLAQKHPDPADRRASLLELTREGERAVASARTHRRNVLDQILAGWTLAEREEFSRALRRFNDTVTDWIEAEEPPGDDDAGDQRST